jgi:hypothetical protein
MFLSFVEVVSCFAQPIAKGVPKLNLGSNRQKMVLFKEKNRF